MDRPLSVFVAVVLVSFCDGGSIQEFCHGKKCPDCNVVEKNELFEERQCAATKWLTSKAEAKTEGAVMAANNKLKVFCEKHQCKDAKDTWPALLTSKGDILEVSWFFPSDTSPEMTNESIRLEQRPAATFYVRVFGGYPGIKSGQENLEKLHVALRDAGKEFDPNTVSWAAYEPYFYPVHHNEVWVPAA